MIVLESAIRIGSVTLRERRGGVWFSAAYAAPDGAARALAAGLVRWRSAGSRAAERVSRSGRRRKVK
jgi:hypothetical protein